MIEELADVFGITVGLGMLLLPYIFQRAGVVLSTAVLALVAVLLVPVAFIINDLIRITGKDINGAVAVLYGRYYPLLSLTLFTYGALTAYTIAAGDQLFAWLGGDPRYWSTAFFLMATFPFAFNYSLSRKIQLYFTSALFFLLIMLLPQSISHASVPVPAIGSLRYVPLLLAVGVFSLFGHSAIKSLRDRLGEKQALQLFFVGYLVAFVFYVVYGMTSASAVENIALISTASLLSVYTPAMQFLLSLIAVLAFYTSFYSISREWLGYTRRFLKGSGQYVFLFFPVALLYLAVRSFHELTVLDLVARVGAFGIFTYISFACIAHYRASRKRATSIPGELSAALAVLFALLSLSCFMPF